MRVRCLVLLMVAAVIGSCSDKPMSEQRVVVLYTAVDAQVAKPIIEAFEKSSGISVRLVTDTEGTKTAGLATRLINEKENPQADVWWGNEVFYTIRLAEEQVLEPYASPSAGDIPANFKDKNNLWAGAALRARVIGLHAPEGSQIRPVSGLQDLIDPQYKDQVCFANPLAGTTGGHVAALYVLWGEDKARAYFQQLKANGAQMLGSNSKVAEVVGMGQKKLCLTDNDDVEAVAINDGKITMILPDQETIGTLTIPCTVALVKGSTHSEDAKKLIDYLLSREVEENLIAAKFAAYSVRAGSAHAVRSMEVDYVEVARTMPKAMREVADLFKE